MARPRSLHPAALTATASQRSFADDAPFHRSHLNGSERVRNSTSIITRVPATIGVRLVPRSRVGRVKDDEPGVPVREARRPVLPSWSITVASGPCKPDVTGSSPVRSVPNLLGSWRITAEPSRRCSTRLVPPCARSGPHSSPGSTPPISDSCAPEIDAEALVVARLLALGERPSVRSHGCPSGRYC